MRGWSRNMPNPQDVPNAQEINDTLQIIGPYLVTLFAGAGIILTTTEANKRKEEKLKKLEQRVEDLEKEVNGLNTKNDTMSKFINKMGLDIKEYREFRAGIEGMQRSGYRPQDDKPQEYELINELSNIKANLDRCAEELEKNFPNYGRKPNDQSYLIAKITEVCSRVMFLSNLTQPQKNKLFQNTEVYFLRKGTDTYHRPEKEEFNSQIISAAEGFLKGDLKSILLSELNESSIDLNDINIEATKANKCFLDCITLMYNIYLANQNRTALEPFFELCSNVNEIKSNVVDFDDAFERDNYSRNSSKSIEFVMVPALIRRDGQKIQVIEKMSVWTS